MRVVRLAIYVVLLTALLFVPLNRIEIANLEPIQAVLMYVVEGNVLLETDTGDIGHGSTVRQALENMKQFSTGIVYLDTAQFLFVADSALEKISEIRQYLKPTVRLSVWNGAGKISDAIRYTKSHKMGVKFRQWNKAVKLPELPLEIQKK